LLFFFPFFFSPLRGSGNCQRPDPFFEKRRDRCGFQSAAFFLPLFFFPPENKTAAFTPSPLLPFSLEEEVWQVTFPLSLLSFSSEGLGPPPQAKRNPRARYPPLFPPGRDSLLKQNYLPLPLPLFPPRTNRHVVPRSLPPGTVSRLAFPQTIALLLFFLGNKEEPNVGACLGASRSLDFPLLLLSFLPLTYAKPGTGSRERRFFFPLSPGRE